MNKYLKFSLIAMLAQFHGAQSFADNQTETQFCEEAPEQLLRLLDLRARECEDMSLKYLECLNKSLNSMKGDFFEEDISGAQKYTNQILLDCEADLESVSSHSLNNESRVKYITDFNFSSNQVFNGTTLGGLSGLSYNDSTKILSAISDDIGNHGAPRKYTFKLSDNLDLSFDKVSELMSEDDKNLHGFGYSNGFDAEGIIDLGDENGFVISTETFFNNGYLHQVKNNKIVGRMSVSSIYNPYELSFYGNESSTSGEIWQEVEGNPSRFCRFLNYLNLTEWACGLKKISGKWKEKVIFDNHIHHTRDVRKVRGGGLEHNSGFEGLGITPNKNFIFTANERPLLQDNPRYDFEMNSTRRWTQDNVKENLIRITRFNKRKNIFSVEHSNEFLYKFDSLKGNGVSEILPLSKNRILVMERAFDSSTRITSVRIYEVNLFGAKDIKHHQSVFTLNKFVPLKKTLLVNLNDMEHEFSAGFRLVDNFEAMTLGPKLPNGSASLILATDNNFRERQLTKILILSLPYSYNFLERLNDEK